jgi:hypothetical protein
VENFPSDILFPALTPADDRGYGRLGVADLVSGGAYAWTKDFHRTIAADNISFLWVLLDGSAERIFR